jgi:hypothetical protein
VPAPHAVQGEQTRSAVAVQDADWYSPMPQVVEQSLQVPESLYCPVPHAVTHCRLPSWAVSSP